MTESFQILATLVALRIALAMTANAAVRGDATGDARTAFAAAVGALCGEVLVALPALALAGLAAALPETLAAATRVAAGLWLAVACIRALRHAWHPSAPRGADTPVAPLGRVLAGAFVDRLRDPGTAARALALFVVTGAGAIGTLAPIVAVAAGGLVWSLVVIAAALPAPRPRLDHHFAGGRH